MDKKEEKTSENKEVVNPLVVHHVHLNLHSELEEDKNKAVEEEEVTTRVPVIVVRSTKEEKKKERGDRKEERRSVIRATSPTEELLRKASIRLSNVESSGQPLKPNHHSTPVLLTPNPDGSVFFPKNAEAKEGMLEKEGRRRDDADGDGDDDQLWVGEHLVREGPLGVAGEVRVQMSEAGRGERSGVVKGEPEEAEGRAKGQVKVKRQFSELGAGKGDTRMAVPEESVVGEREKRRPGNNLQTRGANLAHCAKQDLPNVKVLPEKRGEVPSGSNGKKVGWRDAIKFDRKLANLHLRVDKIFFKSNVCQVPLDK